MKDSGLTWAGAIPASWKLKKIKYTLQERIEKNNPVQTTEILSLTAKQGVIPYEEKEGGGNKPKEDVSAYRLAYPGDIVMNSMNILSGSVGLSKYYGCVSPVYYMLRPREIKEDVRFYNYIFQTTVFQRSLFGLGNGILIKESGNGKLNTIRMRIPMDKFGRLVIPIAPCDEQRRISDYLDNKCTEIDQIAADIQEEIDFLTYIELRRFEDAIETVSQAIAMCDELEDIERYREIRFDAYLFLGRIYAMNGEYIKSEETFAEAEKWISDSPYEWNLPLCPKSIREKAEKEKNLRH